MIYGSEVLTGRLVFCLAAVELTFAKPGWCGKAPKGKCRLGLPCVQAPVDLLQHHTSRGLMVPKLLSI